MSGILSTQERLDNYVNYMQICDPESPELLSAGQPALVKNRTLLLEARIDLFMCCTPTRHREVDFFQRNKQLKNNHISIPHRRGNVFVKFSTTLELVRDV